MAGLFKNLLNMGSAYLQHVNAVRNALTLPEEQMLVNLSSYVSGLSAASFAGFKISMVGLAAKETDITVQQKLQWIVDNADSLRREQFGTEQNYVAYKPEAELSFDAVLKLIDPWFALPQQECLTHLHATLSRMNSSKRRQFIDHLHTIVYNSRNNLQDLKDNEDKAWGGYIEDQMMYRLAKLKTGTSDPAYAKKIETQQQWVRWFEWLANAAENY